MTVAADCCGVKSGEGLLAAEIGEAAGVGDSSGYLCCVSESVV